jgi:prephenate dehydratase
MSIAYLGPEKTNSEAAARIISERIKDNDLIPMRTIQDSAYAVSDGRAAYGVMPCYNYLEGLIQQTLDLIYEKRLYIHDIVRMPITHILGAYPGNKGNTIYSIAVALGQCDEFLMKNYPDAVQFPVSSTSEGARIVSEKKEGMAVSSSDAVRHYGLEVIADDIGNKRHGKKNFTDFYCVADKQDKVYDAKSDYLTMVAITPHVDKPGLLSQILAQVAYHGINNAKIHSRPAIDFVNMDIDPQMFYLEMMCHESSPDFIRCIDALKYGLTPKGKDIEVVRVLGSYKSPVRQGV